MSTSCSDIADAIEEQLEKAGLELPHSPGYDTTENDWVIRAIYTAAITFTPEQIAELNAAARLIDEEEEEEGDDLCDICMRSGVTVDHTTRDGRTVCTECAEEGEDDDDGLYEDDDPDDGHDDPRYGGF